VKRHLNTLFVTTQGSYLAKDGATAAVRVEGETRLRVPLLTLDGLVVFGNVTVSPFLLGACGEHGIGVTFLTENGRFLARATGPTGGNVLLRREQYRRADDPATTAAVARAVVTAKVINARNVLLRSLRDHAPGGDGDRRQPAATELAKLLDALDRSGDADQVRGLEGLAARLYFEAFDDLIRQQRDRFAFAGRSRRPPLDPINALLSFLYALLRHDVTAALEGVGLDPQVGFLHRDRPGRPGLALDLMEELRPLLADRVALSLVNLKQVRPEGFTTSESGGVAMDDETRRTVISAYQQRKQDEVTHPFLGEKTTLGLVPHLQARLLARHLRGDLDGYPPFVPR
jgi:CRISPR-associated protein Cas1